MVILGRDKWKVKNKVMTYIIGGLYKKKPFILVDKVVNFDPNNTTNKLYHSVSNKSIYLSLTGDGTLMKYIKEYDSGIHNKGKKLHINKTFIKYIAKRLSDNYTNLEPKTILYVIDGFKFYRVSIEFLNDRYTKHVKQSLANGEFYTNMSDSKEQIPDLGNKGIQHFGEFWIQKIYSITTNSSELPFEEYFEKEFDFISK